MLEPRDQGRRLTWCLPQTVYTDRHHINTLVTLCYRSGVPISDE